MSDKTLGQKIRELRLARQMTQKELAGDFITRNMLSQIENDNATPSMKSMAYLAAKLNKPIGHFLDKDSGEASLAYLIARLVDQNNGDYEVNMTLLEEAITEKPSWAENKIIMDLYMNGHMHLANRYLEEAAYHEAKEKLMKILRYEKQLLMMTDVYLYKVYDLLADVCSRLGFLEEAKDYYERGKDYINRLVAAREVQSLYINLMDDETETLIKRIDQADTSNYDPYSLARFQMIAGTSMFRCGYNKEAIGYLEKALEYYEHQIQSSVTVMIYEQLSKCYSDSDDYKKAYDYLRKAEMHR